MDPHKKEIYSDIDAPPVVVPVILSAILKHFLNYESFSFKQNTLVVAQLIARFVEQLLFFSGERAEALAVDLVENPVDLGL